jgi:hypothetical protein
MLDPEARGQEGSYLSLMDELIHDIVTMKSADELDKVIESSLNVLKSKGMKPQHLNNSKEPMIEIIKRIRTKYENGQSDAVKFFDDDIIGVYEKAYLTALDRRTNTKCK